MFENMEQLEREIKEFEQNILASKDLIATIRDTTDAVISQSETLETQIGKVVNQLRMIPAEVDEKNSVQIKKLEDSSQKVLEDMQSDMDVILQNLNGTIAEIKMYEKSLENTNEEYVNKVRESIDNSLTAAANDFVQTVRQYNDSLSLAVRSFEKQSDDYTEQLMKTAEGLKAYEKTLNTRYENLLAEVEKTNSKVIETVSTIERSVEEIKKSTESKLNLLTILVIVSIAVSAVSIFL